MGRTAKDKRPVLTPVQKIELSEDNIKRRFIAALIFLLIGAVLLVIWFMSFISAGTGWTAVTAYGSNAGDCGGEFVFQYDIDGSAAEKAVKSVYTGAVQKAHRLFHETELFDDVVNIKRINELPNTELTVDPALYKAFSVLEKYDSRLIYSAPIYVRYDDIFMCTDDSGLIDFDPRLSEEVKEEYAAIARFANDPKSIGIELLGENKIKLRISEAYLEYAKSEDITDFIGFCWFKNAFIADLIADELIKSGYTSGVISSYDGFIRNLDTGGTDFSLNIFDRRGENVYLAAAMHYKGAMSIACYRDHPMNSLDELRFYKLSDGGIRTPYIDAADGFSRSAIPDLTCYSREKTCAELLLETEKIYVSDELDINALQKLSESGIYSVYCVENEIFANEANIELSDIYESYKR